MSFIQPYHSGQWSTHKTEKIECSKEGEKDRTCARKKVIKPVK